MGIDAQKVKEILVSRGVTELYHANTVVTSLSFLRSGGLLSRGYAEDIGLPQTPQRTDVSDKQFGIYYDIFFDATDIHQRARNLNHYGPISFVYSVDVLDHPDIEVKVTKVNPQYWAPDQEAEKRYFLTEAALRLRYSSTDFGQHITICNMHTPLPFVPYLQKIVIEDPQIEDTSLLDNAVKAIQDELNHQRLTIPLQIRECSEDCRCHEAYKQRKKGFAYHRFKTNL